MNINQIARRVNETGGVYAEDMDELKRLMADIWKSKRRLLLQFAKLTK